MLAIFNSLNAHNLPILQTILMILVSKFMVHRALSEKAYLSLGLLSPLKFNFFYKFFQKYQIVKHFWIQIRPNILSGPDLGPNCLQRLLAGTLAHVELKIHYKK